MLCMIDYTGQKYGRLTFLRRTERTSGGIRQWEMRCDCGATTYARAHSVVSGHTTSCGCVAKETQASNTQARRVYDPMISSARLVWRDHYREDSGVDFATFLTLSQLPCDYCGRLPHRVCRVVGQRVSELQLQGGDFAYNGLDRIDPSKGHTSDNVVPCCWDCNRMKGAMTREEFISHIRRMYAHLDVGVPTSERT